MKIERQKDKVIIYGTEDFSLLHTFDCGQCFRFSEKEDGSFSGVAFGKYVRLTEEDDSVIIHMKGEEFGEEWEKFFDLSRDYGEIKKALSHDETMRNAIEFGGGIRILRQEFFECLISFIISQQNNIPRIKKAVEGFCRLFGKKIEAPGGEFYSFPSPEDLRGLKAEDLESLKLGYRAPYIAGAVEEVLSGRINGDELEVLSYEEAKKKLLSVKGIGNKVADCILLFSLGKFEAFPTDTWIKKAMLALYGVEEKNIPAYKEEAFGKYPGFAQQYIFYYMRETGRGK